ncbi:MAG: T9SS type A sorting domain-containing protein [Bacteroidales bacterium]|nr:T9SS type A sorting domain-containing protein [Bacteroidales bacterium]
MNKQLLISFVLPLIVAVAATQNISAQSVPVPTQQADGTWEFTMPDYDVAIEAELVDITINPLSVTEYKYDGAEKKPDVTAKVGTGSSAINIEASKCKATYPNDVINVGTKNITVVKVWNNGGGEATIFTTLSYAITPIVIDPTDPKLSITLNPTSFIYNGEKKEPAVSVKYDGKEIPSSEYTVNYKNNINVGTATAEIVDNNGGNYTINGSKNFDITPFIITPDDPKLSITLNPTSFIYDGTKKEPSVLVKYDGTEIPSTEYTVTYENNINVGTAKAIITDNQGGNYTVNGTAPFTINPLVIAPTDPNLSIILETDTYEYTGLPIEPKVTVTYNDITIPPTEFTVTYQNNTNVGTASVVITDNPNGNYTINGTAPFTITPGIIHITAANVDENGVIIADASNEYFCKGKAVIDFAVQTGTPENYTIEFDGGEISSQNGAITGNSIEIALPKDLRPGTYNGFMELTSNDGNSTGKLPIRVIINLPFYTIVTLYNDVAAVNQLAGEFSAYKWTENGNEISGANGRILQHTFNKSSVYTAILTKTDGGSYETCPLDLSRISVGNSTARLVVYPNPATQGNDITVEVSENYNPEANKQIYIYNLNGTLAKHLSSPQEINKVQLPAGNYSGVYIQNGEKVPFKLIVK